MSVDRSCQYHVDVGETSLVSLVSHDLLCAVPGVELLMATSDGTLLCLTAGNVSDSEVSSMSAVQHEFVRVVSWPRSHNDFLFTDSVSNSSLYNNNNGLFDLAATAGLDAHSTYILHIEPKF